MNVADAIYVPSSNSKVASEQGNKALERLTRTIERDKQRTGSKPEEHRMVKTIVFRAAGVRLSPARLRRACNSDHMKKSSIVVGILAAAAKEIDSLRGNPWARRMANGLGIIVLELVQRRKFARGLLALTELVCSSSGSPHEADLARVIMAAEPAPEYHQGRATPFISSQQIVQVADLHQIREHRRWIAAAVYAMCMCSDTDRPTASAPCPGFRHASRCSHAPALALPIAPLLHKSCILVLSPALTHPVFLLFFSSNSPIDSAFVFPTQDSLDKKHPLHTLTYPYHQSPCLSRTVCEYQIYNVIDYILLSFSVFSLPFCHCIQMHALFLFFPCLFAYVSSQR